MLHAGSRALEGMLQAMCVGDEECMLEVWRSCKEQPKCVESLYNERMAEEKEKAAAAGAKKAQVLFCLILLLLVLLLLHTFPANSQGASCRQAAFQGCHNATP